MFVHIGNDVVVRKEDIIGVFDMDNTTYHVQAVNFLQTHKKQTEYTIFVMIFQNHIS